MSIQSEIDRINAAKADSFAAVVEKGGNWAPSEAHIDTLPSAIRSIDAFSLDKIYPVGSIYISVNATNPGTLFGGTWRQISDKFLLAAGTSHSAGSTGGSESISISEENLPAHKHHLVASATSSTNGVTHTHSIPKLTGTAASNGSHSHDIGRDLDGAGPGSYAYSVHRAGVSGAGGTSPTSSAGAHTHSVSTNASTTGSTSTSHFHTVNIDTDTETSGQGSALPYLPPYLSVYMWERTA